MVNRKKKSEIMDENLSFFSRNEIFLAFNFRRSSKKKTRIGFTAGLKTWKERDPPKRSNF